MSDRIDGSHIKAWRESKGSKWILDYLANSFSRKEIGEQFGKKRSFFRPELPNPYPGEDQSKWGYPITLQLGPRKKGGAPVVAITLHEGDRNAAPADCFLSSPQEPGNPLLIPELTWCLIPKSHLKAGKKYHVKAVFSGDESRTLSWSFTAGGG